MMAGVAGYEDTCGASIISSSIGVDLILSDLYRLTSPALLVQRSHPSLSLAPHNSKQSGQSNSFAIYQSGYSVP